MREFKFRAGYFDEKGNMKVSQPLEFADIHSELYGERYRYYFFLPKSGKAYIKEFFEWTGLKDKKGKDIYEGDIVKDTYNDEIYEIKWCDKNHDNVWGFHPINKKGEHANYYYGGWTYKDFEVVGNIFENSEMIK